jgi:hypothetical protein
MDAIEPRFRPMYEEICVGNKRSDAQDVFFEGMLLEEGLGVYLTTPTSDGPIHVDHSTDTNARRRRSAMVRKVRMGSS